MTDAYICDAIRRPFGKQWLASCFLAILETTRKQAAHMTLDQIERRVAVARRMHSHYVPFVEHCERILQQAHDLGWKVALMLNDECSVRRAESLLGTHIRGDFQASTPLSRLIYGI